MSKRGRKVLSTDCLPWRLPIFPSITLWLLLDRVRAPGWVWGVVGSFMFAIWCGAIYEMSTQRMIVPKELEEE